MEVAKPASLLRLVKKTPLPRAFELILVPNLSLKNEFFTGLYSFGIHLGLGLHLALVLANLQLLLDFFFAFVPQAKFLI